MLKRKSRPIPYARTGLEREDTQEGRRVIRTKSGGLMTPDRRNRRSVTIAAQVILSVIVVFVGTAAAAPQVMCCGQILSNGQQLNTGTGVILSAQTDGNVALYQGGAVKWYTNTVGVSNTYLAAQTDGNVVAYSGIGQWLWKSDTEIYPGSYLRLQDDGNLVVYNSSNSPVWAASWAQSSSGAKSFAQGQFPRYSWSPSTQFGCLNSLWTAESNWQWNAQNPSSSAYGIPQALNPGTTLATAGRNWATDGQTQIQWGLKYISTRYGTPCSAWSHFQSYGWY